jgi:hypothetical protein
MPRPKPIIVPGGAKFPFGGTQTAGQVNLDVDLSPLIEAFKRRKIIEESGLTAEETQGLTIDQVREKIEQQRQQQQTAQDIGVLTGARGERAGPTRPGFPTLPQRDILSAISGLASRGQITPQQVGRGIESLKGIEPGQRPFEALKLTTPTKADITGNPIGANIATAVNTRVGSEVVSADTTIGELNAVFGKIPTSIPQGFQLTVDENGAVTLTKGDLSQITPATKTDFQKIENNALSTLGLIDDFKDALTPQTAGLIADVSRTVEGAIQQGGAVSQFFTGLKNQAETQLNTKEAGMLSKATGKNIFDPNLSAIDFMEVAMVFRVAKVLDPSGRLSDEDFKQAQKALGFDRALTGEAQLRQRIDAFEKFMVRDLKRVRGKLGVTFDKRFKELKDLDMSDEQAFDILIQERF